MSRSMPKPTSRDPRRRGGSVSPGRAETVRPPYAPEVITDPGAVRILCFGDSNTHGTPADDPDYARLPADRRWTGILQSTLGEGFEVVEEGLNGRTTDRDYEDRPGC